MVEFRVTKFEFRIGMFTSIKRSVSRPVLQSLVVSLVLTRLHYWTLAGLPRHLMGILQSVVKAVFSARKLKTVARSVNIKTGANRIAYRLYSWRCLLFDASTVQHPRIFRTKFTVRLTSTLDDDCDRPRRRL